jgi:DNA-binding MarR family transcriptional regulator
VGVAKRGGDDEVIAGVESLRHFTRLSRLLRARDHSKGLNPAQWEALRYLAIANRFSNRPGAMARYLGATKGTTSQTVLSLEKKGLISKQVKSGDQRQTGLALTDAGRVMLRNDALAGFAGDIEAMKPKTRRRFSRAVSDLLTSEIGRLEEPSFGICSSCRYFREVGNGEASHCMKFSTSLSAADEMLICIEHVGR